MSTQPANPKKSNALPVGYKLGEYTIVAVLGDGGFGITYRARDTKLNVDVAIKEYFPSVYADRTDASTIVPRVGADHENYQWGLNEFLKEAQALAKFKHSHIVRVLRFLEANGTAYTIMEYEEGETLSSYLRKHGGVLDEPTLLRIFLPVLNGLQAVHDAGLLHLDIKPDNIYMRANEQPMLIDFGSSRQMRGDVGGKITLTPGFCALEQYPGHGEIGAAADVYGMGATLYRCMTGKNPTDSLARYQAFGRTRLDPLPSATTFDRPLYHPYIRACVDRAMKLVASERPISIFALQQGLMGKDMDKLTTRAPTALLYRPGTGYIGTVLPAEKQKKRKRRYSFLEKLVATTVFVVTFAIITPKYLLDTGRLSENEFYNWIDETKSETIEYVRHLGEEINEKFFGVAPRPKMSAAPVIKRKPATEPAPVAAPATKTPYGTDKQAFAEIRIEGHAPRALGFLKYGAVLAVATDDGIVRLWDMQSASWRTTLPTNVLSTGALGVFPSTQWLAAMNRDQNIAVFDPLGNAELVLNSDPPRPVTAITVSTSGRLLAEAGEDGTISLWELSQKHRLYTWTVPKSVAQVLLFSPDENLLIAADTAGGMTVWDNIDGKLLSHRRAHERRIVAAAYSPDGKRVASVDAGNTIRLWSVPAKGEEWSVAQTPLDVPPGVNSLAFSPDGDWLLATATGGNVYIWNTETGALAHQLSTDRRSLSMLTLTRDGKSLAAVGDDNVIRVWR